MENNLRDEMYHTQSTKAFKLSILFALVAFACLAISALSKSEQCDVQIDVGAYVYLYLFTISIGLFWQRCLCVEEIKSAQKFSKLGLDRALLA